MLEVNRVYGLLLRYRILAHYPLGHGDSSCNLLV